MLTQLGKELRKLRIDNAELLRDMAAKLEISPAMLSSIENGKRKIPNDFLSHIEAAYILSADEKKALYVAYFNTLNEVRIGLNEKSKSDQDLVLAFARRFDDLDASSKDAIAKILNEPTDEQEVE
jgi:transcriptional regulator with XRE-family HTH domain